MILQLLIIVKPWSWPLSWWDAPLLPPTLLPPCHYHHDHDHVDYNDHDAKWEWECRWGRWWSIMSFPCANFIGRGEFWRWHIGQPRNCAYCVLYQNNMWRAMCNNMWWAMQIPFISFTSCAAMYGNLWHRRKELNCTISTNICLTFSKIKTLAIIKCRK